MTVDVYVDASFSGPQGDPYCAGWGAVVEVEGRRHTASGTTPGMALVNTQHAEAFAAVEGARFAAALYPSATVVVHTDCEPLVLALAGDHAAYAPYRLALDRLGAAVEVVWASRTGLAGAHALARAAMRARRAQITEAA